MANTDDQSILRGIQAKRAAAQARIAHGRAMQRSGAEQEARGLADAADCDAAERVFSEILRDRNEKQHGPSNSPANAQTFSSHVSATNQHWQELLKGSLTSNALQGATNQSRPRRLLPSELMTSRRLKDEVVDLTLKALKDGSTLTTEEIFVMLLQHGVQLTAANPTQRVSQILSETPLFRAQRGKGWSLALASELTCGTIQHTDFDEILRLQAKRTVVETERNKA
jgi:hypothetical protein